MPGRFLAGIVLVALTGLAPQMQAAVLSPNALVDGVSQAVWGDRWWQWMISYPPGADPMTDTTGAYSSLGDRGTVFYLAGTVSGSATRTATVKQGQTIFIPLAGAVSPIPLFGNNEAEVRADAAATLGTPSNLVLTIDGVMATLPAGFPSLTSFHQSTPPGTFTWVVPQNNIYSSFGLPGGSFQ